MKVLKSIYHESEKDEFYLEILDELVCTPSGFEGHVEPCYKVKAFPNQGYVEDISYLRKSLIGVLYEEVDYRPKQKKLFEQLKLF